MTIYHPCALAVSIIIYVVIDIIRCFELASLCVWARCAPFIDVTLRMPMIGWHSLFNAQLHIYNKTQSLNNQNNWYMSMD